jgi:hypothetical protein
MTNRSCMFSRWPSVYGCFAVRRDVCVLLGRYGALGRQGGLKRHTRPKGAAYSAVRVQPFPMDFRYAFIALM